MVDELLVGRRVLIVEDEMMVAILLEDMLVELGCELAGSEARAGPAVVLITSGAPIDAAVVDVSLGGENSYAVAEALIARGIPFVFSTGYGEERVPIEYRAVPVLRKPFRNRDLGLALRALLTVTRPVGPDQSAPP